jgi:hypothetical protein
MITLSLEVSPGRARRIMGRNYFGIEEAVRHFGAKPSAQDIATLSEIPFTGETLTKCKDSHVLVAVLPVSIDDIYAAVGSRVFCKETHYCYGDEVTADCGHASWQLVRRAVRPEWDWKTWEEQQSLLPKGEQTAPARTMVYTMVGHCLETGERLFPLQRVAARNCGYREAEADGGWASLPMASGSRPDRMMSGMGTSASRRSGPATERQPSSSFSGTFGAIAEGSFFCTARQRRRPLNSPHDCAASTPLGGRVSGSWTFPDRVACEPAATARLGLAACGFGSSRAIVGQRGQLVFD